MQMLV
jgi:hypothetical protein